jgi:translocation and assembly module TamB
MPETAITAPGGGQEIATLSRQKHWGKRLLTELSVLLLLLLSLAVGGLILLDTAPGHRFIVDRLAQVETATGLRIRVARIEGSIYGEARLKGVSVSDPQGVFLTSPEIMIDWAPGAWLYNNLHIDQLESPLVRLDRLPRLRQNRAQGPDTAQFRHPYRPPED